MRRFLIVLLLVGAVPMVSSRSPTSGAERLITAPDAEQNSPEQTSTVQSEFKDVRPSGPPLIFGVNEGTVLRLPGKAKTLFVGNEEIADVRVADERVQSEFVFLTAKKPGSTVIYAADLAGNILLSRMIRVDGPVSIVRRGEVGTGGEPPPGPVVLQLPLSPASTSAPGAAAASAPTAAPR